MSGCRLPPWLLQAQLEQCGSLIDDAQWDSLRLILPRIKGNPTNAGEQTNAAFRASGEGGMGGGGGGRWRRKLGGGGR
jgi:hypothetical protein